MSNKDSRRHRRIPYIGPIQISWEASGQTRFAQGKCIDISESGLRIEVPAPVPPRANLSVRAERIKLSGSATVKHVARYGSKYILGIEMSQRLGDKTLSAIREPWALRTPANVA
ncbi:MAG TPA: PilZ domain-containing protein [Bryobacteraceae bacterium]|nr:PilZ domain-containing protein [Bryobacteraceae bacterium]